MIVSSRGEPSIHADDRSIIVTTPLDAILRLQEPQRIHTVVLVGSYATNGELVAFLTECYPAIHLECET